MIELPIALTTYHPGRNIEIDFPFETKKSAQTCDWRPSPSPSAPESAAAPIQHDVHERRFIFHDVIIVVLPGPLAQ